MKKCWETHNQYSSEIIALVPVATNTRHWKDFIFGKASCVCFLYDTRVKFLINGEESDKGAPMACAIVYWGKRKERFKDVFTEHGYVVNL